MNTRFLIVPVAALVSTVFIGAATTPASAREAVSCTAAPAQLRAAAAATADQATQRKVLSLVNTGEKLCAADAKFEAGKKFAAAAKALGTDMAQLAAATPTAQ
jgi:hypothetical protein